MPHTLMAGFRSFEISPDAADRPAGADADHQVRHPPLGLLPDLGPGLLVVRGRVRQVVVLVRLPRIGHLAFEARRHRVVRARVFRIDVGRTDDDLGAEGLQRVDLLLRLLVGGGEDALVALHDGRNGQPHAGVARRAFDDRAAGLEPAVALGVLDHAHRHAVLDRVARVERLDLGQHVGLGGAPREAVDAHHRRARRWRRGCCRRSASRVPSAVSPGGRGNAGRLAARPPPAWRTRRSCSCGGAASSQSISCLAAPRVPTAPCGEPRMSRVRRVRARYLRTGRLGLPEPHSE